MFFFKGSCGSIYGSAFAGDYTPNCLLVFRIHHRAFLMDDINLVRAAGPVSWLLVENKNFA